MSQRGFTLIEMAMVILLIGLIVSGGLFALAPVLDRAKTNQTNATLDQVENALVLFAIRNSRLPCPTDGSLTSGNTYGVEIPQGGGSCTVAAANAIIPWKSLGLDESYSNDAWGHRLSYWTSGMPGIGTGIVTNLNFLTRQGKTFPTGPFINVYDVVSLQAVTPDPTRTTAPNVNDQAAYVLVSHGKTGWYAWNKNGTSVPAQIVGGAKQCNSSPATCSISGGVAAFASGGPIGVFPPTSNTYFDDLVRWRSPAFIIQLCGSGGPCGNP